MMESLHEDIKGLFVWTLGPVIRVIQLIRKIKNLFFRTFESLASWSVRSRLTVAFVRSFGSFFSFVSCFVKFCVYFLKLIVDGTLAKRQIKRDNYKLTIMWSKEQAPRPNGCCKVKVDGSVRSPKFIC